MNEIFKGFYKNKKVLVTGHTGFKGSWLTFWLSNLGANVKGYSLNPHTYPNLFEILRLENNLENIIGNVINFEHLNSVIKNFQPEIVFHLAAQPLVKSSYLEPRLTYETNIMGTVNLLESVRNTKSVKSVLVITTDKCYENNEQDKSYHENDPMGGYDPYSSSKGCAELIVSAYRNSFFNLDKYGINHNTSISSARAGNVIGGGDWSNDRLIPDCINSLINEESIVIRSPNSIRPWQHVLETISGYLWLAKKMFNHGVNYSQSWNFGPNDESIITVENIVNSTIKHWGTGSYKVCGESLFHEAKLLKLDISKVSSELNWKPSYDIGNAIEKTVLWYKKYYEKSDMSKFTMDQINDYSNQAKKMNIEWAM